MGHMGYSYVTSALYIELKNINSINRNGKWEAYLNYGGHNRIFLNKNYDLVIRQDQPTSYEENFNMNEITARSYNCSFDVEKLIFNKLLEKHGKEFFINNPKFDLKVYVSEEQHHNNEYTDVMHKLNAYNLIFYIKNKNNEDEVFPYILDFNTYKLIKWHAHVTTEELFNYAFTDCPYQDNGLVCSYKKLNLNSDEPYELCYTDSKIYDVLSFSQNPVLMSVILNQILENNGIQISDINEITKISYLRSYSIILTYIGTRNADVKKGITNIYNTNNRYRYGNGNNPEERIFLNCTFDKYLNSNIHGYDGYKNRVERWLHNNPLENALKLCDYYISYCVAYICGTPIEFNKEHKDSELYSEIERSLNYKRLKKDNPKSELLKFWDEQYKTFKDAFDLINYKDLKISFNKYYRLYKTLTTSKTIDKYILRKMLIQKIKEDTANGVDVIVEYQISKNNLAEILVEV